MIKNQSEQAQAAKLIRSYMKNNGVAGSVRSEVFSGGTGVHVTVSDMSPCDIKRLENYACQFQCGTVNGWKDMYEYTNVRSDLPQVKFVFVRNDMSDALRQKIWDFLKGYYVGMEQAPQSAREAWVFYHKKFGKFGSDMIQQSFGGFAGHAFWDFYKEKEAA